jgi:hypothetical protein
MRMANRLSGPRLAGETVSSLAGIGHPGSTSPSSSSVRPGSFHLKLQPVSVCRLGVKRYSRILPDSYVLMSSIPINGCSQGRSFRSWGRLTAVDIQLTNCCQRIHYFSTLIEYKHHHSTDFE